MYRPLGRGDVDFAAIVGYLRDRGYDGWYVLEQDTILTEEPRGEGPVARRPAKRRLPAQAAGLAPADPAPMRIGLLGLGRIGAFHAETLAGLPAVEELVLSDPVPPRPC